MARYSRSSASLHPCSRGIVVRWRLKFSMNMSERSVKKKKKKKQNSTSTIFVEGRHAGPRKRPREMQTLTKSISILYFATSFLSPYTFRVIHQDLRTPKILARKNLRCHSKKLIDNLQKSSSSSNHHRIHISFHQHDLKIHFFGGGDNILIFSLLAGGWGLLNFATC